MTRMHMLMVFGGISFAGLCLIAYGLVSGKRGRPDPVQAGKLSLGFSDSPEKPCEIFDLDMGHEGLQHRPRERFEPGRPPERIGSVKKAPEEREETLEDKPLKIEIS